MNIYLTSDLHFGHNKPYIVEDNGFVSIEEHDNTIVERWNAVVKPEDTVYLLGDVTVGDNEAGMEKLKQLNGTIHIIRGNHDTNNKIKKYMECENVYKKVETAELLEQDSITFYLSHYPTFVSHSKLHPIHRAVVSLFGHTHQDSNFFMVNGERHPYMYHVGVNSHNYTPVLLEDIVKEIKEEKEVYDKLHGEDFS